jgi:hypothetical protein
MKMKNKLKIIFIEYLVKQQEQLDESFHHKQLSK